MKKITTWFLILFVLLIPGFFISCASTAVESQGVSSENVGEDNKIAEFNRLKEIAENAACENTKEYYDAAIKAIMENNNKDFLEIVDKWENEAPKDPELYICKFNYYINKARRSVMSLDSEPPVDGKEYLKMKDDEKNQDLYFSEVIVYEPELVKEGTDNLHEALKLYPNRLDIWFGLVSAYLEVDDFGKAEKVISDCINQSKVNDNKWLWAMNEPFAYNDNKAKRDLEYIVSIHDYLEKLYLEETDETYNIAKNISKKLLDRFPDSPVLYNFFGVDAFNLGNILEAGTYFEKAHSLDPSDMLIVGNLANFYGLNENKEKFDYCVNLLKNSGQANYVEYTKTLLKQYFVK